MYLPLFASWCVGVCSMSFTCVTCLVLFSILWRNNLDNLWQLKAELFEVWVSNHHDLLKVSRNWKYVSRLIALLIQTLLRLFWPWSQTLHSYKVRLMIKFLSSRLGAHCTFYTLCVVSRKVVMWWFTVYNTEITDTCNSICGFPLCILHSIMSRDDIILQRRI